LYLVPRALLSLLVLRIIAPESAFPSTSGDRTKVHGKCVSSALFNEQLVVRNRRVRRDVAKHRSIVPVGYRSALAPLIPKAYQNPHKVQHLRIPRDIRLIVNIFFKNLKITGNSKIHTNLKTPTLERRNRVFRDKEKRNLLLFKNLCVIITLYIFPEENFRFLWKKIL
jgi:hypothetical protein